MFTIYKKFFLFGEIIILNTIVTTILANIIFIFYNIIKIKKEKKRKVKNLSLLSVITILCQLWVGGYHI